MSDAWEALADVRGWLCDNLSDKEAGKVCGMLSAVSREINRLGDENAKLRDYAHALEECRKEAYYCEFCPHCNFNFEDEEPRCDFDFDALRSAAGMEVDE